MKPIVVVFSFFVASMLAVPAVEAQSGTLEVVVSYRERIALPPGAQLEVRLIDTSQADTPAGQISLQRYSMSGVPMNVTLAYDPELIDERKSYILAASIWAGDVQLFRTTRPYTVLTGSGAAAADVVLSIVGDNEEMATPFKSISGVRWSITELIGERWDTDDPAILLIDDEMNVSIFGGCNRFNGRVIISEGNIAFPENMAGTLMSCPNDVEVLERRFVEALRRATSYVRYGAGLILTDASGRALMHFEDRPE